MSPFETKRLIKRIVQCIMIALAVSMGWLYLWYRVTGDIGALSCIFLLVFVGIIAEAVSEPYKLLMDERIDEEKSKADWKELLRKLDGERPYT